VVEHAEEEGEEQGHGLVHDELGVLADAVDDFVLERTPPFRLFLAQPIDLLELKSYLVVEVDLPDELLLVLLLDTVVQLPEELRLQVLHLYLLFQAVDLAVLIQIVIGVKPQRVGHPWWRSYRCCRPIVRF